MRLLPPQEVKDSKELEQTRKIVRAQEIEKVIKDINIRLAKAQADFNDMLAKNREKWAKEEEEYLEWKRDTQKETEELEAKKLKASIPLKILKDRVNQEVKDASELLTSVRRKEENVEKLTEELENKLDEVGEREQTVKSQENALILRMEGVKRQEESIVLGSQKLTDEMTQFARKKEADERALSEQKTSLFMKERSLESKEQSLIRTDKALSEKEVRLQDEREVLDRAWKELKRMGGQKPPISP